MHSDHYASAAYGYRTLQIVLLTLLSLSVGPQYSSAQFSTVLNIPPQPGLGGNELIGSDTQLNLADGGFIGNFLRIGEANGSSTNVEVNISGGSLGFEANAYHGSTVNISGGTVGYGFDAYSGSLINISGGEFGDHFAVAEGAVANIYGGAFGEHVEAKHGSRFNLFGGEFQLDGQPIPGLTSDGESLAFDVPADSILTGILADGTPFAFSESDRIYIPCPVCRGGGYGFDTITAGTLTLHRTPLPEIGPVVVTPSDGQNGSPLLGIRQGQTLTVSPGETLADNFNAGAGSTVVVAGGEIGRNFEATGGTVVVSSGSVGRHFDAFPGTTVVVSGGTIGDELDAFTGSNVTIAGGAVGESFDAFPGSNVNLSSGSIGFGFIAHGDNVVNISGGAVGGRFVAGSSNGAGDHVLVNISGGNIGRSFLALASSTVNISGGTFGDRFSAQNGSRVTFIGNDFQLDGTPIAGLATDGDRATIDVPEGSLLSGTLADGTPFAFSSHDFDTFAAGVLTLQAAPLPPIGPTLITTSTHAVPMGIRRGQTLQVEAGTALPDNFNAGPESAVVVQAGGQVDDNLEAVGAEILVKGRVGRYFDAFRGTELIVTGGTIGPHFSAFGSSITLVDGEIGTDFRVRDSELNIAGGTVEHSISAHHSTVNLNGGAINESILAYEGAVVHMSEGIVGGSIRVEGGSTAHISGGAIIGEVSASGESAVNVSGGEIAGSISVIGESAVNVAGGATVGRVSVSGGSAVSISGGSILRNLRAGQGDTVTISGGAFGNYFNTGTADLTLIGGEFRVNGEFVEGLGTVGSSVSLELREGALLTGTLADGTPFAFSGTDYDALYRSNLTLTAAELPVVGPSLITTAADALPLGIRQGQTLLVNGGAVVPVNFNAGRGSRVVVEPGGEVGPNLEASGATVTIAGGVIADSFGAFDGTTVHIVAGKIAPRFHARDSIVNVSGGEVGSVFTADDGAIVNISGGTFGESFHARDGSVVNLFGTEFYLDGMDLTGSLTLNIPLEITGRELTLTGLLADGSPFSFDLISTFDRFDYADYFESKAMVTVTLVPSAVPEPASLLMAVAVGLAVLFIRHRPR